MHQKYYNEMNVKGGPATDFLQFIEDMEFWNLSAMKLETFNIQIIFLEYWEEYLQNINTQLLLEMDEPIDIKVNNVIR